VEHKKQSALQAFFQRIRPRESNGLAKIKMSLSRHSFARTPRSKKSQSITLQASELDPLLQYEEEIRLRHPVLAEFSVGNIDMIDEATLILNKRVKIMICEDTDITQEKTDVIVNSADLSLNHYTGGLAGNIIL
jgi:hypothetical protein